MVAYTLTQNHPYMSSTHELAVTRFHFSSDPSPVSGYFAYWKFIIKLSFDIHNIIYTDYAYSMYDPACRYWHCIISYTTSNVLFLSFWSHKIPVCSTIPSYSSFLFWSLHKNTYKLPSTLKYWLLWSVCLFYYPMVLWYFMKVWNMGCFEQPLSLLILMKC